MEPPSDDGRSIAVRLAGASRGRTPPRRVHVIVLAGAGGAFCAGYDLTYYAQGSGGTGVTRRCPGIR
jgi:enoyl-CoA hydratase